MKEINEKAGVRKLVAQAKRLRNAESMKELADLIGFSPQKLNMMVSRGKPTIEFIENVCSGEESIYYCPVMGLLSFDEILAIRGGGD